MGALKASKGDSPQFAVNLANDRAESEMSRTREEPEQTHMLGNSCCVMWLFWGVRLSSICAPHTPIMAGWNQVCNNSSLEMSRTREEPEQTHMLGNSCCVMWLFWGVRLSSICAPHTPIMAGWNQVCNNSCHYKASHIMAQSNENSGAQSLSILFSYRFCHINTSHYAQGQSM